MSKKNRRKGQIETLDQGQILTDKSPRIYQESKLKWNLSIRERSDLTERQKVIIETMLDKKTRAVFIDGIYGSSKTFLSVLASLKLLGMGKIDKILYIRNPVESSSTGKLGFTPGEASEKFSVYTVPLIEKLEEMLPSNEITALQKENRIEGIPLGYVRGRNWNCKAVIVDEAACLSYEDIILLMTRCGEFTKIFFVGDATNQNDIGNKTGFRRVFDIFNDIESKEHGVFTFELKDSSDIVRSKFVRFLADKLGMIRRPLTTATISEPMFPTVSNIGNKI